MVTFDAVVVGGGVAGSVAAREMGLLGMRVALVERKRHPRPKACGEGLLPHGLRALRGMGLDFPGVPVKGLRFVTESGVSAQAPFPGGEGMVVRRERFDARLFEAAAGTPNVEAVSGVQYDARRWTARWVVGADGLHSQFHRGEEFGARRPAERRVGLSTHVTGLAVDRDHVEVILHEGGEVYLAPSEGDEALVACLYHLDGFPAAPSNEARVLRTLRSLAALKGRCGKLAFTTPVLGAGPLGLRVAHPVVGQAVLVGDAAGAPDPVTGEGMSLAVLSAGALARALARDRPAEYEAARRRFEAGPGWLSRWLLLASRRPPSAARVVASLNRHPDLFARLLEVATGARSPRGLGLVDLARLAL